MTEEKNNNNKRQTAYEVRIKDLLEGEYVKKEGWDPNYIITKNNIKVSRVNIISTVISILPPEIGFSSINVDDGTGNISIRSFGEEKILQNVNIGEIITIIGKPRTYNEEIYIIPEIIKKLTNKKWLEFRKLKLNNIDEVTEKQKETEPKLEKPSEIIKENIEEVKKEENDAELICTLIKEIDKGPGADIEEVISKSKCSDTEKIISNLLMQGDIFEVTKGKIKVLD